MDLGSLTGPQLVFPDLPAVDAEGVLRVFSQRLASRGVVADGEALYDKLVEREQLGSTGIGSGVAIPHCKMNGLEEAVLAVGMTAEPVDFGAVDSQPVRLFFLVVSPSDAPAVHLQVLAAISKWVKADKHVDRILAMDDAERIVDFLRKESG